jgi:hypothetical protein
MQDSDQDIVRRALSSVLDRLEGARAETEITGGASVNQSSRDRQTRSPMSSDGGSGNSIIVILLGESNAGGGGIHNFSAQPGESRTEMREDRARRNQISYGRDVASEHSGMQSGHPGLEKFPIAETETAPSAPKTCFMEPGRVCVNSGACEMRGY